MHCNGGTKVKEDLHNLNHYAAPGLRNTITKPYKVKHRSVLWNLRCLA